MMQLGRDRKSCINYVGSAKACPQARLDNDLSKHALYDGRA